VLLLIINVITICCRSKPCSAQWKWNSGCSSRWKRNPLYKSCRKKPVRSCGGHTSQQWNR